VSTLPQDDALLAEAKAKKLQAERAPLTPQERIAVAEEQQAKALEQIRDELRRQGREIDALSERISSW